MQHRHQRPVLLVAVWLISGMLAAQGGAISLTTGYHHIARQDQVFSPMIHRGTAFPNIGLGYVHQSPVRRHAARLGYDGYTAGFADPYTFTDLVDGSEETTARSAFTLVDLSYEAQWNVSDTGRTRFLVGGGFFGQLGSIDHGYAYPSFGYTIFFGIGPSARAEHALNERTLLHAGLSLPFLSWVARSPYALNDDDFIEDQRSHKTMPTLGAFIAGGRWASFGSFRRALLTLGADHRFAARWTLSGRYTLEYLDVSRPARLISFRNGIDATITYHFRKP